MMTCLLETVAGLGNRERDWHVQNKYRLQAWNKMG